jgi:hypothetical protein
LNTNDDKIQWHPAFDAALQIELEDEAEYLEFEPEHLLSKKPMQIDVLVKNKKDIKSKRISEESFGSIILLSTNHRMTN